MHVATLVLPLYPHGPTNGIDFVIKSPQDQWLARQEHDGRKSNFYIDFYEAAQAVRGAVDVAGMHADEEALKVGCFVGGLFCGWVVLWVGCFVGGFVGRVFCVGSS